jgi:two-component system, NarL family, sensor kinase
VTDRLLDSDRDGTAAAPAAAVPSAHAEGAPTAGLTWATVTRATATGRTDTAPPRLRRVFVQVAAAAAVVLAVVAVAGAVASRKIAEREAVHDAAATTDLLAESAVQPAVTDDLLTGSPSAVEAMDTVVRRSVLGDSVVRVKLWTPDGRIVYSDEPRLVGSTFALGEEEQDVLAHPMTHAEVSDLSRPENRFEQGRGRLLEVYRPVWTPSGQPLLFETYLPYDTVSTRTGQLWRGFAGITVSSLLLLIVLMLPILWRLLDRLRAAHDQRVQLLEHAVDASTVERQRVAASLHDGVVQELAGASFAVAGAADRARTEGHEDIAGTLSTASDAVRGAVAGVRSLLVDIYPPSLSSAGLVAALTDLVATSSTRDVDVRLVLPPDGWTGLDGDGERLVYRVAQEALRNAVRHARAAHVVLRVDEEPGLVTLTVSDDGVGFDPVAVLATPPEGHLGLRVMADLAEQAGAQLSVASAPGAGTRWRLVVVRP